MSIPIGTRIDGDGSGFKASLDRARRDAKQWSSDIKNEIGKVIISYQSISKIQALFDQAERIEILSKRLKVSQEQIQAWDYAMKQSGGTVEDLADKLTKLDLAREGALGGNQDKLSAFKFLGIGLSQLQSLSREDLFNAVARSPNVGSLNAEQSQSIFGKGSEDFIIILQEGFAELTEEAKKIGAILKDDVITSLSEAGDALQRGLIPGMVTLTNLVTKTVQSLTIGATAAWSIIGPIVKNIATNIYRLEKFKAQTLGEFIAGVLTNKEAGFKEFPKFEPSGPALKSALNAGPQIVDLWSQLVGVWKGTNDKKPSPDSPIRQIQEKQSNIEKIFEEEDKYFNSIAYARALEGSMKESVKQPGQFMSNLNDLQRIGARSEAAVYVDLQRQALQKLEAIKNNTKKSADKQEQPGATY